ncbi:MAG: signal peptide peptidase SppA [Bacteroidaceae bacterium]|nr:signal peptide peptidase SppA [Bacteroidaceae bacterium]MBR1541255.1 signal peptide peptidase SppA [Bacteroidaceae bacterium]
MKDFFKYVLATVVGLIVAGLVMMFLGVLTIFGFASSSDGDVTVESNSVLKLKLDGVLSERATTPSPLDILGDMNPMGSSGGSIGLDDVLSAIKKAAENEDIKGIYLEAATLDAQPASYEAIRDALVDFKANTDKFIIAYGDDYDQMMYYLASTADKILLNPKGSVDWHGLAGMNMFYKDLMDKLGIEMEIFKVGTFKSAVEPYMLTEMSDANREQIAAYIGSIWNKFTSEVAASRNLTPDALNNLADEGALFKTGEEMIAAGLVDSLIYKNDMRAYLNKYMGLEEDKEISSYGVSEMRGVKRNTPKDKSGNIVAVYYAYGGIDDTGSILGGSSDGIESEKVIKDLRKLQDDEDVKAVVLRVNSPGGSAYGSEQIWYAVSQLKTKKPVIVSMGDYAASGGYYISCNADTIVAEPTTLTGSIGIFGMMPNFEKVTKKIGVNVDVEKTNALADMGNSYRAMTEREKALMQKTIERGYDLFTTRCAEGRGKTQAQIDEIGQGRVWTGEMALELGLVDVLGGLDDAIDIAVKKAGVEAYTLKNYPEKESGMLSSILGMMNESIRLNGVLKGDAAQIFNDVYTISQIEKMDRVQARMPNAIIIR